MIELELRYVAHLTTLTNRLRERYRTGAHSLGELIAELDRVYPGFGSLFANPESGQINLNAMIYYRGEGQLLVPVTDLKHPIHDQGTVVFW